MPFDLETDETRLNPKAAARGGGRSHKSRNGADQRRPIAPDTSDSGLLSEGIEVSAAAEQQSVQQTAVSLPGQPGNQAARTHGLFSQQTPPELLVMQKAFEDAVLADEAETPSALRRQQIANLAVSQRLLWQVVGALEQRGVVDSNGKLRALWLQRIDALTSQCKSISQLLGLKREARDITPTSPADIVAAAQREDA